MHKNPRWTQKIILTTRSARKKSCVAQLEQRAKQPVHRLLPARTPWSTIAVQILVHKVHLPLKVLLVQEEVAVEEQEVAAVLVDAAEEVEHEVAVAVASLLVHEDRSDS